MQLIEHRFYRNATINRRCTVAPTSTPC
jgi:hypothetical protein